MFGPYFTPKSIQTYRNLPVYTPEKATAQNVVGGPNLSCIVRETTSIWPYPTSAKIHKHLTLLRPPESIPAHKHKVARVESDYVVCRNFFLYRFSCIPALLQALLRQLRLRIVIRRRRRGIRRVHSRTLRLCEELNPLRLNLLRMLHKRAVGPFNLALRLRTNHAITKFQVKRAFNKTGSSPTRIVGVTPRHRFRHGSLTPQGLKQKVLCKSASRSMN